MVDFERQLNPSQLAAVTATDGPVLVLAGAGSGKTRVIEYRVLYLVRNKVSPNSILLLTFTRRAAREMLSRAARHDPGCKNVEGGTFHSFAFKALKRYAKVIGLADSFSVLDEGDAEEAVQRCTTRLGLFEKVKRYPKKDTLRAIISMSVNKAMPVGEVLKKEYPHFLEYAADIENLRKAYVEYKILKNYLDYDDLLVYLLILLENREVRERMSRRYRYLMVDEYQDTNRLQGDIACLLAEVHRNVMVVGDDAQSIYGFRGASHENIMEFPRRFPGCRIIKLEENYRSTQSILDLANVVLENMKEKYSKCLVSARNLQGVKPRLLFFRDAYEEADWIAGKIKELRDEGISLGHQAVLYRSSYISIPLQAELSRRNIPYEVYGGLKFYETAHVKDVMAHMKALVNPKDELAWNRILMLIEGIGPRTADGLVEEILGCSGLGEIIGRFSGKRPKGSRYYEGLIRLLSVLQSASGAAVNVGERLGVILDYYHPLLRDKFDDWHLRTNDLITLRQIAMRYKSPEDFLNDFAIEPPERGIWRVEPSTPEEERPLTLSTIHLSKGLEWEVVFLLGLMDGVLPVSFSLDSEDDIEEEQRIFYVAVTRAKNHLFLSLHHEGMRGGISQFNKVSRFLDSPNIRAKIEEGEMAGSPQEAWEEEGEKESAGVPVVSDKDSLLKRMIAFLEVRRRV
jgi:DNA helicase-2/ATP-dependent DNA helicase PcrA